MYATPVQLDSPTTVYHLPTWNSGNETRRIAFLREQAVSWGKDPRIRELAVRILRMAKVPPRDYRGQAAALLKWVQEYIYYANEPGEILQSPIYTITRRLGDCDDEALLLASLYEAIRLPSHYVLTGSTVQGQKVRWVEGEPLPSLGVTWGHIYVQVGNHPFKPTAWVFAEPTLRGAPLGWDVVTGMNDPKTRKQFPELYGDTGMVNPEGVSWQSVAWTVAIGASTSLVAGLVLEAIRDGKKKRR